MATYTSRIIPATPSYSLRPWPKSFVYGLLDVDWDTIIDVDWNNIQIFADPWYSAPTTFNERTAPNTTYSTRIIP